MLCGRAHSERRQWYGTASRTGCMGGLWVVASASLTNGCGCSSCEHKRTTYEQQGAGVFDALAKPFFWGRTAHGIAVFERGEALRLPLAEGKRKVSLYPPQMSLTLERRWTAVHVSSIPRVSILLSVGGRLSPLCGRACRRGESAKERTRHALQERGHSEVGRDGRVIGRLGRIAHLGESWWG
jgi:hypothetical protein